MEMEQAECSETSAYKLQTSGNYPKVSIQHTEHGESLKIKNSCILFRMRNISNKFVDKIETHTFDSLNISHQQMHPLFELAKKRNIP